MTAPTGQPFPRFCATCGLQLAGPAPRCPRCGADVAAAATAKPGGMGGLGVVAIVIGVGVVGIACIGMLAAIAIPNFMRYQLRSKVSEVRVEVAALAKGERATLEQKGKYVAVPMMPASAPGPTKAALTPEELKLAAAVEWMAPPAAYGRYAVAISEDGAAAAVCGESDIDGDQVLAVVVAFLPDAAGNAPDAPCTAPVAYQGQPALEPVQVTESDVF